LQNVNMSAIKTTQSKSGSATGSFLTSTSDLERMERLINQAQHASKPILKFFGKYFEEFRRDQAYCREIVFSDLAHTPSEVPEPMIKHSDSFNKSR
jgi:hypothetical protein